MEYRVDGRNLKRAEIDRIHREEATERQEAHNKLSKAEKLAKLDAKLGKGVGAKRERARLAQ